jgi:AcrR family transcriptional regulator
VPRTPDASRRDALLASVIASCAERGIGNRSLRDLADAAGTSHRMLIHHFGSREELLLAIVDEVESQQKQRAATLPDEPAAAMQAMWDALRVPRLWPFARLFFECYARGAQGEEPFARMHPFAVNGWLAHVGDTPDTRLGLAVMRGLLLDLVATKDTAAVDAAAARFVELLRRDAAPQRA